MPNVVTRVKPVVNLRQLAKELNVSVSLVSKVLNGRMGNSGANVATIRAIHDKARDLGYRKNMLAWSLSQGRQNALAVCVHRHGEAISTIVDDMVRGIAEEAVRQQQRLALYYYQTKAEFDVLCPALHASAVDGVILGGLSHPELMGELNAISSRGVAIITIHDQQIAPAFPNVGLDQMDMVRRATLHLLDQGCRQVAYLRINPMQTQTQSRYEGYCQALAERGVPYCPERVIDTAHYGYHHGVQAMGKLLASSMPFDGVVAPSDSLAIAALNLLMRAGRPVPRQVKVIGIDNSPFCDMAPVPLTSMSQEFYVRGRQAVTLLMRKLQGQSVDSVQIAPVIHVRESSSDDSLAKTKEASDAG